MKSNWHKLNHIQRNIERDTIQQKQKWVKRKSHNINEGGGRNHQKNCSNCEIQPQNPADNTTTSNNNNNNNTGSA